jgi:hypothetical protein
MKKQNFKLKNLNNVKVAGSFYEKKGKNGGKRALIFLIFLPGLRPAKKLFIGEQIGV